MKLTTIEKILKNSSSKTFALNNANIILFELKDKICSAVIKDDYLVVYSFFIDVEKNISPLFLYKIKLSHFFNDSDKFLKYCDNLINEFDMLEFVKWDEFNLSRVIIQIKTLKIIFS